MNGQNSLEVEVVQTFVSFISYQIAFFSFNMYVKSLYT